MSKPKKATATFTLEVECVIQATVTPGDPGCRTLRNGDPGYPPTAPELDDIRLILNQHEKDRVAGVLRGYLSNPGREISGVVQGILEALSGDAWERAIDEVQEDILQRAAEDDGPDPDDEYDRRRDDRDEDDVLDQRAIYREGKRGEVEP